MAIEAHAEVAVGSGASETLPDGRVVVRSDAYLVARDRWTEVWRAAQEVESLLADRGVEVRVAGPLPPYHFVAVDLREAAGA